MLTALDFKEVSSATTTMIPLTRRGEEMATRVAGARISVEDMRTSKLGSRASIEGYLCSLSSEGGGRDIPGRTGDDRKVTQRATSHQC